MLHLDAALLSLSQAANASDTLNANARVVRSGPPAPPVRAIALSNRAPTTARITAGTISMAFGQVSVTNPDYTPTEIQSPCMPNETIRNRMKTLDSRAVRDKLLSGPSGPCTLPYMLASLVNQSMAQICCLCCASVSSGTGRLVH
jgi:hypothetical protein